MKNYPKVSIVTITYGHEKYIINTLDGVLMQDYPGEIEFIISNDCSPDNTDKIIHDYLTKKNIPNNINIQYTNHKVNKGILPNFSWALQEATGKYIAYCEGDDYWTDPLKLRKQVEFMEVNSDCSMCYHSVRHVFMAENKRDKIAGLMTDVDLKFTSEEFISSKYARTVTILIRASVIQNFSDLISQSPIADYPLQMFCAMQGNIGYIGGDPMAVYRVGTSGSTNHGRFGDKEEQKQWIRRRLYSHKKSRDLFNRYSDYSYNSVIQQQKQKFSFEMLYSGLSNFNRLEMLTLYKEYMPNPYKLDRRTIRFWFRFLFGPKLYDYLKKRNFKMTLSNS